MTPEQSMIPKSLHTVTALQNVARLINPAAPASAVRAAAAALGYPDTPDVYGLIERAIKGLT